MLLVERGFWAASHPSTSARQKATVNILCEKVEAVFSSQA